MTTTHEPEIDVCKRMCNNVEQHMQTTGTVAITSTASVTPTTTYYEPNSSFYTQVYPADSQQPDNLFIAAGHLIINEEGYWGSPSSSDHSIQNARDYSPINILHHQPPSSPSPSSSSFHQYAPVYYQSQFDRPDHIYDEGYYGGRRATITGAATTTATSSSSSSSATVLHLQSVPFVRVVKRRTTANKKERRRTQSINSAFSYLRECIPNVPSDTKLSKIKTLRLATSYISYLTEVLKGHQDPSSGFRAELVPSSRKINAERRAKYEAQGLLTPESIEFRKCKGRTGWPQHVWASELKQEQ